MSHTTTMPDLLASVRRFIQKERDSRRDTFFSYERDGSHVTVGRRDPLHPKFVPSYEWKRQES
jgi:hypothetical protein